MPGAGERGDDMDEARAAVLRQHARVIAERSASGAPITAANSFRPPPALTSSQGLGLLAVAALVLLSGLVGGTLVERFGVRAFSLALLLIAGGAAVGLRDVARESGGAFSLFERIALLGTLIAATLTGSPLPLLLLPAVVHAAVARLMFASLDAPMSLVERGARLSHPLAPSFIGPYCRKLTVVWGLAFAASAVVTTALAFGGYNEGHRMWTGWLFWTLLSAFCVVEFFWRKAWFRYYGKGPFDRFLAGLFPPENTARGRRSQAYLERMREELARLAEIERVGSSERSSG